MYYTKSVTFKNDYSSFCERGFIEDFNCIEVSYIDGSTYYENSCNLPFQE